MRRHLVRRQARRSVKDSSPAFSHEKQPSGELPALLSYSLICIILQIGLSHVLAKALFEAKGSYIELMRAYMLGPMFVGKLRDSVRRRLRRRIEMLDEENLVALLVVKQFVDKIFGH